MLILNKYLNQIPLFFLFIYLFSLPMAGVNAVQNISLALFLLSFFIMEYKEIHFKDIFHFKYLMYILLGILLLAFISLFFTPDFNESLKEIKSELIRNIILLIVFFYYMVLNIEKKDFLKKIIVILFVILCFHTFYNIYTWFVHGGFPFRAGGLLDNGGGERFGIWATYFSAFSIAMFFSKYKKFALFLFSLSLISIFANHTRATYLFLIVATIFSVFYFIKNKKILIPLVLSIIVCSIIFVEMSKNFNKRYNIHNLLNNIELIYKLPPSQFKEIEKVGIGSSVLARLSMWKSIILYRVEEPFVPLGYGRFLFQDIIQDKYKNKKENLPYLTQFDQAHNEYIGLLLSLGLCGLILFVLLLIYKIKMATHIIKNKFSNEYEKVFAVFVLYGTIGFIVSLMFGSFFGDSEAKFFYPIYGLLLGIFYNQKKNENFKLK